MAKKQPEVKQQVPEASSKMNARIFVMPKAYRHGKEVAVVMPKQEKPKHVVQAPPVVQKPQQVKRLLPKKKNKTTRALLIAGVVVMVALLIGGYLVLRSTQKQDVPSAPVVQTPPAPREAPESAEPVTPTEPTVPIEPSEPFVKIVVPGKDVDSDGLSDVEERLVYGTNPNLPDTDSDGFLDGNEVFHRYNPNGTAPGTLVESGLATVREEETFTILFPTIWTVGKSENGLLFISTTGEQIRIVVVDLVGDASAQRQTWTAALKKDVVASKSRMGFDLHVSNDNLNAFLVVGEHVLKFEYDPGVKSTVDYLQTFQMMINSVELKAL